MLEVVWMTFFLERPYGVAAERRCKVALVPPSDGNASDIGMSLWPSRSERVSQRLHGVTPVRSLPCTARPMITFITFFELQMHPNVSKNSMWEICKISSSPTISSPTISSPTEVGCDDCCSLLLKDYSDDFQDWNQVVFSLPGSRLSLNGFTITPAEDVYTGEYEDLKASKLGVFIKFKELGVGWTSRLVHFILCFQLDIKKKFELWSLVVSQPVRFSLIDFEHLTGLNCDYIKDLENPRCEVTKEMAAFWEKMGVDLDTGPSIEQITKAFYRCDDWSRDDRKRLGYLAIYAGYIEGKKFSTATRASHARLVMDLEKFENYPWGRVAFKVLMDSLKAKDLTQTGYTVDGFIQVLQILFNKFPTASDVPGLLIMEQPHLNCGGASSGLQIGKKRLQL
ncbi:hypothetical protein F2Q70_00043523 [Brassica cretica]|uniref:DUF1985 domain-containing protein n=1 Tax=Brassica cretica TaxID=69181 RepID=A0A8S9KFS0_BRACR|nr:hypothetical protein F2Q70_00043523 [Brassica cretica]